MNEFNMLIEIFGNNGSILVLFFACFVNIFVYKIYRSLNSNEDWYNASPYASTFQKFYVDEGVNEDLTYYYRISAFENDEDEGLLSFVKHGRLSLDSTSAKLTGAIGRVENLSPIYSGDPYTLEGFFQFDADETERSVFGFLPTATKTFS